MAVASSCMCNDKIRALTGFGIGVRDGRGIAFRYNNTRRAFFSRIRYIICVRKKLLIL